MATPRRKVVPIRSLAAAIAVLFFGLSDGFNFIGKQPPATRVSTESRVSPRAPLKLRRECILVHRKGP
jgi:hypothetical protein